MVWRTAVKAEAGAYAEELARRMAALDGQLAVLRTCVGVSGVGVAIDRWRSDAGALRFHARGTSGPVMVGIIGGTGTGKSTLANRLLGANLSAASFRRTFTSGPIAFANDASDVPDGWLGMEHRVVGLDEAPVRGQSDCLMVLPVGHELTRQAVLVDTPDLDGDQPLHHAQADRVFRWAQAVLFLVSPEKYQMTELLPYYRLALRYRLAAVFVMNKCQSAEMLEDYGRLLVTAGFGAGEGKGGEGNGAAAEALPLFALPRDDAAYEPPPRSNLAALSAALSGLRPASGEAARSGLEHRTADLLSRLQDEVLTPLRRQRQEADRMIASLRAMETPSVDVDASPIAWQLQRRLQQRSILYLMGPQRILRRVRQVPGLLVRLPRLAWDLVARGKAPRIDEPEDCEAQGQSARAPDFRAALLDQWSILQSRVEDVLRSNVVGERWLNENEGSYRAARLEAEAAGRIADEELEELNEWLRRRWNSTPRDTALLQRLLKHLPGGQRLARWSEAAPYLLALIVLTHGAFFGPVDLLVIGGWSLSTWLGEKLSNEVSSRARATNRRMQQRFAELAHEQIGRVCRWLDGQVPAMAALEELEEKAGQMAE